MYGLPCLLVFMCLALPVAMLASPIFVWGFDPKKRSVFCGRLSATSTVGILRVVVHFWRGAPPVKRGAELLQCFR